jgi:hypothetical protein
MKHNLHTQDDHRFYIQNFVISVKLI